MPIKYIPLIPEAVEGQAVLGIFNRILEYKGADYAKQVYIRRNPKEAEGHCPSRA